MVKKGINLWNKIFKHGIEVYRVRIEVIEKLPPLTSIRVIQSLLGHAVFTKDFSKIENAQCKLLEKELKFVFDDAYLKTLKYLKERFIQAHIIVFPDYSTPFEVLSDECGAALGVILGQRREKILHPIYDVNKALNPAQKYYTIIKQELLTLVFAFGIF